MDSYLLDWANLLLRGLHVVSAIAWIGASFYFVFLDSSLTPPQDEALRRQGVDGELWAVHGGGFYHPVKFNVAPPALPARLHWFYWESYSTWLSGLALFALTYLWQARTYLLDPARLDWPPLAAGALALAFPLGFWLLYDTLCRVVGLRRHGQALVGAGVLLMVALAAWLACRWFAPRAAFVLVGATLATAMSANVFFCIIPGQRAVLAQVHAGQPVDPRHGQRGKQRSVHNTYLTLPVLFAMLSPHYGWVSDHPHNWLVLLLMMLAGAAIRQFFVLRHGHRLGRGRHPWPYALAGGLLLLGLAWWLRPAPAPVAQAPAAPRFAAVQQVLAQRCASCHGETVQMKGLRFDSPALAQRHAAAIVQQVVRLRLMPLNNATGITEAERALLGAWFAAGAPVGP